MDSPQEQPLTSACNVSRVSLKRVGDMGLFLVLLVSVYDDADDDQYDDKCDVIPFHTIELFD